ncbi:MAG: radical SAM protein [Dehalococcoidales bacterium]|nr:radical SAM protein [Dehalococcoidales bacterium]
MVKDKHSITWEEREKARRQLSRESGTIIKDWGGKLPFALVYPNSYYIGMSNLGLQGIYGWLNRHDRVLCERVFWDREIRGTGSVPLSVESQRPLSDFAVAAFSLNYEIDYFNIAPLLKASGIPPFSVERDERQPLVIAGGPCVMANPMPVAPFFDCLCIGEAEAILPSLLPVLSRDISASREELIEELSALPGIYIPGHHHGRSVIRQWVKNLDEYPLHSVVVTPDTELHDLYLIEIERGCAHGCRFCMVSQFFSPMRFHDPDRIVQLAAEGLQSHRRLGLMGPAVTDHPEIEGILERLLGLGANFSISSLRLDSLTPGLLEQMKRGGLRSIALAPEAGSEGLRHAIKKGIDESQILEAVLRAAEKGMQQIKLYFMNGLPGETGQDIEAMACLVLEAKKIIDHSRAGTRLTVNLSPFIPKAGTEFQRMPMAPLDTIRQGTDYLKTRLAGRGIRIKHESPQWSEVQAVLSRGDSSLAAVLAEVERDSFPEWQKMLAEKQIDADYFAHRQWDSNNILPWNIIASRSAAREGPESYGPGGPGNKELNPPFSSPSR